MEGAQQVSIKENKDSRNEIELLNEQIEETKTDEQSTMLKTKELLEEKDCEINNYRTVFGILEKRLEDITIDNKSYMKENEENIIKETEYNHITNNNISPLEKDLIATNAELEKQSKLISDLIDADYKAKI